MLTAAQCEIVAYYREGEILCPKCAIGQEVTPVIEYELSTWNEGSDMSPDFWEDAFEGVQHVLECYCYHDPGVDCGRCGRELDESYTETDPRCQEFTDSDGSEP